METANFTSEVFAYVEHTYGKNLLKKLKQKKNSEVVERLLASSLKNEYGIDRTANKIIAMLRLNP